jgi:hypothetical protein
MAQPLIFKEILIATSADASPETYDLHLVESAEVTLEPVTSEVEDGQTLTDRYNASFSVDLYDLTALADARVYTDATAAVTKGNITFKGSADGTADLKLSNVIINGTRVFDGNRVKARLTGTKTGIDIDTIAVTTVS